MEIWDGDGVMGWGLGRDGVGMGLGWGRDGDGVGMEWGGHRGWEWDVMAQHGTAWRGQRGRPWCGTGMAGAAPGRWERLGWG